MVVGMVEVGVVEVVAVLVVKVPRQARFNKVV
jgi:hypothetical protein